MCPDLAGMPNSKLWGMAWFPSKQHSPCGCYWRGCAPMTMPPKADPVKHCEFCGERLHRKRFSGRLEDRNVFLRRRFCDRRCGSSKKEVGKSAHHWRAQRYREDACKECQSTEDLHVHHADGDYRNDAPENLVTLCASCHLELHWREDRKQRVAAIRAAVQRPMRACEVCEAQFRPANTGARTCSAACKAVLLSWSQPMSRSGHRGVYWDGAREKWQARAKRGGRFVSVGRFDSLDEAVAAVSAISEAS